MRIWSLFIFITFVYTQLINCFLCPITKLDQLINEVFDEYQKHARMSSFYSSAHQQTAKDQSVFNACCVPLCTCAYNCVQILPELAPAVSLQTAVCEQIFDELLRPSNTREQIWTTERGYILLSSFTVLNVQPKLLSAKIYVAIRGSFVFVKPYSLGSVPFCSFRTYYLPTQNEHTQSLTFG